MKKGLKVLLIILGSIVVIVVGSFLLMKNSEDKALASIVYEDIDMNQTKDGTYCGEADAMMVYVKVAVTVENHAIKNIDIIEHNNGRGAKAESITNTIMDKNSYDVEVISGATLSSKTIMSAVSKALKESCK